MFRTLLFIAYCMTRIVAAAEPVDYVRDVKPVLQKRCYACHGALKQSGNLRLDTAESAIRGGDSGPAVKPRDAATSQLLMRVTSSDPDLRMPQEGEPLTADQVAKLRAWIESGSDAPDDEQPETDPRDHWSFRPIVRPAEPDLPPSVKAWCRNPIDTFIAVEHVRRNLTPVHEASREALLRRVSIDLIGLPPTRSELQEFLASNAADAYESAVDRLLASPHYGERWARHWMDVWRYSDWYGRRHVPDVWNSAPQVFRWRDWIVSSLNADKGYDRMVQEMLAADEVTPGDGEAAVATGYLARNWYALNPNQWMRDIVEHTGKAFLGLTFNCAHCHDHKYDPILQSDYFRLRAFFEPLQLRQDRWPGEPDPGPFQKYEYSKLRRIVNLGSISVFDETLDAKTFMYQAGDERQRIDGQDPVSPGAPTALLPTSLPISVVDLPAEAYYPGLRRDLIDTERAQLRAAITAAESELAKATGHNGADKSVMSANIDAAKAALASFEARLAAEQAKFGLMTQQSLSVDELVRVGVRAEREAAVKSAAALLTLKQQARAAAEAKPETDKDRANAIQAATKQVQDAQTALDLANKSLADADTATSFTPLSAIYPARSSGRRRALAEWITSPTNPLAARVAVNHIWSRHLGRPIVVTVADFGRNGAPPTHPELLDWLACELMAPDLCSSGERGLWQMKKIHRLIVTSQTYRLASQTSNDSSRPMGLLAEGDRSESIDLENKLYWRFTPWRMQAESVRDSLLWLAGQLEETYGGIPLDNKAEAGSRRRSLYFSVFPEDGGQMEFLQLFDPPDPCDCYQRNETVVPQQALALTNSDLTLQSSQNIARHLSENAWTRGADSESGDAAFVVAAFEHVLTRSPSPEERQACQEFLTRQSAVASADTQATPDSEPMLSKQRLNARASLVRVLLNHDDFVTIR